VGASYLACMVSSISSDMTKISIFLVTNEDVFLVLLFVCETVTLCNGLNKAENEAQWHFASNCGYGWYMHLDAKIIV